MPSKAPESDVAHGRGSQFTSPRLKHYRPFCGVKSLMDLRGALQSRTSLINLLKSTYIFCSAKSRLLFELRAAPQSCCCGGYYALSASADPPLT